MLSIFKRQYAFVAVGITIVALFFLHTVFQLQDTAVPELWKNGAPLALILYKTYFNILQQAYISYSLSILFIAFQCFLIYLITEKVRGLEENKYIYMWLYVWFIHGFKELHTFSPALISSTFLLSSIYLFLKYYDTTRYGFYFHIGFLLGLAILFWYPSVLMLSFFIVLFIQYNISKLKTIVVTIFSSFVIILDYYIIQFIITKKITLIQDIQCLYLRLPSLAPQSIVTYITMSLILLAVLSGLIISAQNSSKGNQNIRLFFGMILTMLVIFSFQLFLTDGMLVYGFSFLILPSVIYLNSLINNFKRIWIKEIVHLTLLLLFVLNGLFYHANLI